jgi:2-hydroxychromene-2-carboxylate isomerase
MARLIEFYFDFPSPYSYLANTQLAGLAAKAGAGISYIPFRILELMKLVGNRPTTIESPNKGKYAGADLARWAARYQVKLQRNPGMRSFDFAELGRGALVAGEQGRAADYVNAVFPAVWADTIDLTDRAAFAGLLDRVGFDGAKLLESAGQSEYVAKLDQATAAAAERGVFGSPTFFVGEQMFFGNDRLMFVGDALQAAA